MPSDVKYTDITSGYFNHLQERFGPEKEFAERQLAYKQEVKSIVEEGCVMLRNAVTNQEDLKAFFPKLMNFLAQKRHEISLKANPSETRDFGIDRSLGSIQEWPLTGLYSPYENYNDTLLKKIQSYLKTMNYNKRMFIDKKAKFKLEPVFGRKSELDVEIFSSESSKEWGFQFDITACKRLCTFCGLDFKNDDEAKSKASDIPKNKELMSILKTKSPEDYKKIKISNLVCNIRSNPNFSQFRKSDWILATVRLEINKKMVALTQYLTWTYRTFQDDPVDYMTNRSVIFLIHQELSLIPYVINDIAELFKDAVKMDGMSQDLINTIKLINYEFAHVMPYRRGSSAIGEFLEMILFKYHGHTLQYAKGTNTNMEALISSLKEFSDNYSSFNSITPQLSQTCESKDIPQEKANAEFNQWLDLIGVSQYKDSFFSLTPEASRAITPPEEKSIREPNSENPVSFHTP